MTITDKNAREIIESGKPVVIDCWATWCGPCKAMSPLIDQLAEEYEGKVVIGKYNVDEEGDLVTQIVDGRNCVFTTYGPGGMCMCAIEKAFRDGKIDFYKPISCHLYPVRIKEYDGFTAINLHRWKICRCAEVLGREKGVRAYQFLKTPLIRRFGQEWYDELALTCEEYLRQNPGK